MRLPMECINPASTEVEAGPWVVTLVIMAPSSLVGITMGRRAVEGLEGSREKMPPVSTLREREGKSLLEAVCGFEGGMEGKVD